MKRFYIVFMCVFSVSIIYAQQRPSSLPKDIVEECYGNLRAEMTRSVCDICNVADTTILNSIESYSMTKFFNKRNAKLKNIVTQKFTLDGPEIPKIYSQIRNIKESYESKLIQTYPEKSDSIIAEFRKYDALISALSIECISFNRDTTSNKGAYISKYPQGRFYLERDSVKCKSVISFRDEKDILIADLQSDIRLLNDQISKLEKEGKQDASTQKLSEKYKVRLYIFLLSTLFIIVLILFLVKKYPKQSKSCIEHISRIYKMISKKKQSENFNGGTELTDATSTKSESSTGNEENDSDGGGDISEKEPERKVPQPYAEKFAIENNEWIVVGASVIGRGHVESNMHCQDSNTYADLGNGWGIAITSDGAGSAKYSHVGSKIVVTRTKSYFEQLILGSSWYKDNALPDDLTWSKLVFKALKAVRNDLQKFADGKQVKLESFAATVIVVVHTPNGLLVAHIGDGRAGYQDQSGTWHSVITPHKGEEANQTIFITSDFWNIPFYEMSGALVPETRVIKESTKSFVLMSDGCEHTSWDCNLYNADKGIYYDPNTPHTAFFNPLIETLKELKKGKFSFDERSEKWYNYLDQGNKSFIKETDDKTMILGTIS
ncbi:MAG: protein phosphatase 2C domain-containing protein [Bacteroides sp.]|nr:protein phosphatase 2C domain-containing protein [Bacteroides sp.]